MRGMRAGHSCAIVRRQCSGRAKVSTAISQEHSNKVELLERAINKPIDTVPLVVETPMHFSRSKARDEGILSSESRLQNSPTQSRAPTTLST